MVMLVFFPLFYPLCDWHIVSFLGQCQGCGHGDVWCLVGTCCSENAKENDGKDACHDTDEGHPSAERTSGAHVLAVHKERKGKHGHRPRVATLEVETVERIAHKVVAVVSVL